MHVMYTRVSIPYAITIHMCIYIDGLYPVRPCDTPPADPIRIITTK